MKKGKMILIVSAFALWAVMPRGTANATPACPATTYVNCSTGAPPFTPTSVGPNKSVEQQVTCNDGDTATGGGIEVLSPALPLPPLQVVTTPENSFLFSDTTPVGWQVVVQNTNPDLACIFNPKKCTIQFRVCVGCLHSNCPL